MISLLKQWLTQGTSPSKDFETQDDLEKVETAVCLESVLEICYQSFSQLIHNRTIREESQKFRVVSQKHQRDLRQWLPYSAGSEASIEQRIQEYLVNLDPSHLSLVGVVNLSISLAAHKLDIYKFLLHAYGKHHYFLLNKLIEDTQEELEFLRHEKEFHQGLPTQVHVRIN